MELLYTVWLSLSCTPGTETFAKLISKFSTPHNVYFADNESIAACIGSQSRDYNLLIDKTTDKAQKIIDYCERKNIGILTYFDDSFPDSMRNIKNPPVLLYYRGHLPNFNKETCISIVGTRRLTAYGRKNTFTVAYDLARSGAIIVSGMAIGIDGVALAGAVSAGKSTVAILGSGIDVCYPIQHQKLAREIVKSGCVLTEYAPGTRPERYNFPIRNRLISAISKAVIVMEGKERSGALITARCAQEQGKTVYAFPGNVGNECSEASNLLIKNGARLFTSADDIVRDFDKMLPGSLNPFKLAEHSEIKMNEVLLQLQVACVTASDDIFRTYKSKSSSPSASSEEHFAESGVSDAVIAKNEAAVTSSFDKSTIALYKKIPQASDCSVEELVDGEHDLRDVMQSLLKLEIARFVVMLPGDRVKRNM